MNRMKDKVALVTGGSKGIGEGIVRRFAEEDAIVIIASRKTEESEKLAAELVESGYRTDAHRLDVSSLDEWKTIIDYIIGKYGRIDVLANNAGVAPTGLPMDQMDIERDWHMLINTNLTGTFYGMLSVIPHMVKLGGGAVVNTSSYGAGCAICGANGYTAAKGGINALTRAAAAEYGKNNVRVNAVGPGATLTPAVAELLDTVPDVVDGLIAKNILPRLGTPKDLGDAFVYLASDESSYVTGQFLLVDGGYTVI